MFGGLTSLYVKGVQGFYTKMTGRQKIALINTIANYLIVTSLPEKVSHVTTTPSSRRPKQHKTKIDQNPAVWSRLKPQNCFKKAAAYGQRRGRLFVRGGR